MHVSVNGVRLAYSTRGTGEPALVLLHAYPFSRVMWEPQIDEFSREHRVIALDYRGFGDSAEWDGRYSAELLADDVNGVLDHLGLQSVVLCGLSMGGFVSLAFYRKHPERVRGLVLADTRGGPETPALRQTREQMRSLILSGGTAALSDDVLPNVLTQSTLNGNAALVDRVRGIIEANRVSAVVGALTALSERPDARDLLPTIACPVLVMVGAKDIATPPWEAEAIAGAIPHAWLRIIPEAGHLPNLEQADAFNGALREWLLREVID